MGRKPTDSKPTILGHKILFAMGIISCIIVYGFMSAVLRPSSDISKIQTSEILETESAYLDNNEEDGCCKGVENLELWGDAVKSGSDFKVKSSYECCKACKAMCTGKDGPCCDSWVFCGDKEACGSKYGECWLKKQKDTFAPERHESGNKVMWTSGLVFGRGKDIIGLETEYGTLFIKLLPECSPNSVAYILELMKSRHCAGCQFYRAETRGHSWDPHGNHIADASYGPPYALIQGTLDAQGAAFVPIASEFCPTLRRGSVAWIESGPEFFISLSNHDEWKKSFTVFGSVLPEDMVIAEKIAQLPTKSDVWNNVNVAVLQKPVPLRVRRM